MAGPGCGWALCVSYKQKIKSSASVETNPHQAGPVTLLGREKRKVVLATGVALSSLLLTAASVKDSVVV